MISGTTCFIQAKCIQIPTNNFTLLLYNSKVKAGFPSPADDYIDAKLDLNQYLIKHPAATFFMRAVGNPLIGISENDLLIVDRSLKAVSGNTVVAVVEGEFAVRRFRQSSQGYFLFVDDPQYSPIQLDGHQDACIWGVVTSVIHHL